MGNPLEEEISMAGKYNDEVSRRLLYLKKLDGFPVIRMMVEEDIEEVTSTMDIKEIARMAGDFDDEDKVVEEKDSKENAEGEDDNPDEEDGNDEDSDADSDSQEEDEHDEHEEEEEGDGEGEEEGEGDED